MKKEFLTLLVMLTILSTYAQEYNFYAGNLHAHTLYSDGNKEGLEKKDKDHPASAAYKFAMKDRKYFDFLGISEHNHSQANMKLANYAEGLKQAEAANSGNFVCLYGMEYGVIKNGGHVLIYGVDQLIGWEKGNFDIECPKSDYIALWDLLKDFPDAFATLAHPEPEHFESLITAPYNKNADKVICGVAVFTGPAFAKKSDYKSEPAKKFLTYFRGLLAAGYHVGPTVDHDNHYLTFGRMASSRTITLATKLDRDLIMDAYRQMRFYASTDWNVEVTFTINGFPMGQRINTRSAANIKVEVKDKDANDKVSTIKVMYGKPGSKVLSTQLTKSDTNSVSYKDDLPKGSEFYYYLEITQEDGDKMYTSPIWVHRLK